MKHASRTPRIAEAWAGGSAEVGGRGRRGRSAHLAHQPLVDQGEEARVTLLDGPDGVPEASPGEELIDLGEHVALADPGLPSLVDSGWVLHRSSQKVACKYSVCYGMSYL